MELEEHYSSVRPDWLRLLLTNPRTLPTGTLAIYVTGGMESPLVLSVAPGVLSINMFAWKRTPYEKYIQQTRDDVPVSRVASIHFEESIAPGANKSFEWFDATARIALTSDLGSLGTSISLPMSEDYSFFPEKRVATLSFFVKSLEELLGQT